MAAGIMILPFSHMDDIDPERDIHPHWLLKASKARQDAKKKQEYAAGFLAARLEKFLGRPFGVILGEQGKPLAKINGTPVWFNISHTPGLAVLAYSEQTDVGIDTERIRKKPAAVAKRFFTEPEQRYLEDGDEDETVSERFFRIWTAKEACMKLTGEGLRLSPEKIEVSGLEELSDRAGLQELHGLVMKEDEGVCHLVRMSTYLFQTVEEDRFLITAAWGECLSEPVKIDIL